MVDHLGKEELHHLTAARWVCAGVCWRVLAESSIARQAPRRLLSDCSLADDDVTGLGRGGGLSSDASALGQREVAERVGCEEACAAASVQLDTCVLSSTLFPNQKQN